jgi:hypothetical protein
VPNRITAVKSFITLAPGRLAEEVWSVSVESEKEKKFLKLFILLLLPNFLEEDPKWLGSE